MTLPIIYSFRRCPYAIRARYALSHARISCVIREVDLKNKPKELIELSPKGTVPVLQLKNGDVIDESIKIVEWALRQIGEDNLILDLEKKAQAIIKVNDTTFAKIIHRYKYRDKYPEEDFEVNKTDLYHHLEQLDRELQERLFLLADFMTKADIAVFPFVRQVVQIRPEEFAHSSLQRLLKWLDKFLQSPDFAHAMTKYPVWAHGDENIIF